MLHRLLTLALAALLVTAGCAPDDQPQPPAGADGVTPIHQIQGDGPRSPLEGQQVLVEGVVTQLTPDLGGLFLQSAPGAEDDDPATSEGIFVVLPAEGVEVLEVGEALRIRGTVVERGSDTAARTLTSVEAAELESLGPAALPEPVVIREAPETEDGWDRLEAMRIRVEGPLVVAGQSGLLRFGELITAMGERPFQPTELHPPGPEADALAVSNAARMLVLDDGSDAQWPDEPAFLDRWPDHDAPLRAGSELGPITGVLDVRRGGFLLLPDSLIEVTRQAPRPVEPPTVGPEEGDADAQGLLLRVAVLNVENLFNGDGTGGGFPTPRGAETFEDYQLQQAKLVATLQSVEADVAALAEVENDGIGPLTAISQFVDALNEAGPVRDWAAVEVADGPGTDAIRVGILYRTSRVVPVGPYVFPDDAIFEWGSRPPLGQTFRRIDEEGTPRGEAWMVVSNHLKSKAGCPGEDHPRARPGDEDMGDGQACWNAHRVEAARAMADWLDTDPSGTGVGAAGSLIVGDLNSNGREDPIRLLEERGWMDGFLLAGWELPYSYVFRGQSGRLDHVLIHEARREALVGAAIWHTNADEFSGFGYEWDPDPGVWRSSDHDLLLVGVATEWGEGTDAASAGGAAMGSVADLAAGATSGSASASTHGSDLQPSAPAGAHHD